MIDVEYLEMCRALPRWVKKSIPDTIETRWCNGYQIYIYIKGYDEFGDENNIEYQIQHCKPPFKVKKPFKVPKQEDLQAIYKKKQDCNFEFMLLRFRKFIDKGIWSYGENEIGELTFILDFNIIWILFVMQTCYGKQWDKEKKMWVSL